MKAGSEKDYNKWSGAGRVHIERTGVSESVFPIRELLFGALLIAVIGGIIVSAMNHYVTHGLWYITVTTLRLYLLAGILVLSCLQVIRLAASKVGTKRTSSIVVNVLVFIIFVYLASRLISYSSVIRDVIQNPTYARIALFGSSFISGIVTFIVVRRISVPLQALARRVFPLTLVVSFVIIVSPFFFRNIADNNIVLITVDTLRADHLGCYGYHRDTSPNIDEFARKSYLFTQPIVQWPKTSPSFSSILTSLYCGQTGVTQTRQKLPPGLTTTAEYLLNAGYTTAAVLGNGNLAKEYNFDQGFSIFIETWKDDYIEQKRRCDARHITDYALKLLPDLRHEEGFFLWLHYVDPHARYTPPEPFHEMFVNDEYYGDKTIKLNEDLNDDIGGVPGRSILDGRNNLYYYIAQYDAEIRYCDSELAKVFDYLRKNDLLQNTMVIVSSDHGESLGDHNYYFEHGKFPYDACLRVPLIVFVPGGGSGVVSTPVALLDIHPTILNFAGIEPAHEISEGTSLLEAVAAQREIGDGKVFSQSGSARDPVWSVRDGRWKLIYTPTPKFRSVMTGSLYELYDLSSDPAETVNIYDPNLEHVSELKAELEQWIETQKMENRSNGNAFDATDESTRENLKALGYIE